MYSCASQLPLLLTLCTLALPSLASLTSNHIGPLGHNYKESCSDTEPCNPIKFLECRRGICECIAANEIIYDKRSEGCSALAGFSCLRQIPGQSRRQRKNIVDTIPPPEIDSNDPYAKYQIACVPHAKCSYPEDICECEFRYYKAANATCLRQRSFGERCNADEQCDKYKFLSCISGSCTCDRNHRYDTKNEKCMVPVGEDCKIIDYVSISEEHFQDDECPEDATCAPSSADSDKGVCKCDPGFKLSSDKTCGRDWGDECNTNTKCSDIQFHCRNGKCQCKYPMHQYYDEDLRKCVSISGGPCDPPNSSEETFTECTENSACYESTPFNYCRCQSGFIETNEGKCVKAYGSVCKMDEECDPLPSLACINNACSCPDQLQMYEDKHRACVSLAGGRCRKEANSTMPSCTANAYCVKASGQLDFGRCICARGTTTTSSRLCAKSQ